MFTSRKIAVLGNKDLGKYAVKFDGNNDRISVARDSDLDAGTSPFAISIWVKMTRGTEDEQFVGKGIMGMVWPTNDMGWAIGYKNVVDDVGQFRFDSHYYADASNKALAALNLTYAELGIDFDDLDNKWIHLAGTRTTHDADGTHNPSGVNSKYKFFFNGEKYETVTAVDGGTLDLLAADGAIDDNTQNFRVGVDATNGRDFQGSVSDVAYYKGEILEDDIMRIYSAGRDAFNHGNWEKSNALTLWWKMGDGTENGLGRTIYDMSSNSYNGTLANDAEIVQST